MSLLNDGQPPGQGTPPGDAGNQGHNVTDWRTSLPEDVRSEKVFESIKGKDLAEALPTLAKNYVNAQRLVGQKGLIVPGDKATPEEIAVFRKGLGVPDKPEEYGYRLPEGLTEDRIDKARVDLWKKEMHEAGIPKAAAERLISKYLAEEQGSIQAQLAAREKTIEGYELQVKQKFGDKFDETLNNARFAVKQFGDAEMIKLLDESGLGSHPAVIEMLAKIGQQIGDDRGRGGNQRPGNFDTMRPEDAQHALNSFNRDEAKQQALFSPDHPRHEDVVKERAALFQAAFPPEKKE